MVTSVPPQLFYYLVWLMFLILNQVFPLVSTMESSYGKEYNYDTHNNLSTFDVMYDNESQILGKSYEDRTAEWWK